jgi:glutaredoxin
MTGSPSSLEGHSVATGGKVRQPSSVTIYTTPHCHWCKVAKRYFAEKNIDFVEVDVATSGRARREMVLMTGQQAVPVIRVGGHAMVGWDVREFEMLLGGRFKRR